jgi:DNA polymerase
MSDDTPKSSAELKRQLQLHLESLRACGVEWAPVVGPLPLAETVAPPAVSVSSAAPQAALPAVPAFQPPLLFDTGSQPAPGGNTREQRARELEVLRECVAECTLCKHLAVTRTQTVFGVGPLDPEVCFIGEAPGATEDARGEPFVGEAGQLLNRIIAACGMKREQVYIGNIIKCRPPGNREPNAEEAANCREHLEKQLALVRPKHICCLGACAAKNLLSTSQGIGKLRGRVLRFNDIPVVCTYHPAYLLRYPENKKLVWEDMKKLLALMGRSIPQKP